MFHYFGVITNTAGDSLVGWQVEVVQGAAVVPLYSDNAATTPIELTSGITNRAKTDAYGGFDFYVAEGEYAIRYYNAAGTLQRTQAAVPMYGAEQVTVATAQADIATTQAAAATTQAGIASTAANTATAAQVAAAASVSTAEARAAEAATAAANAQSYIAGAAPFGLFVNLASVTVPAGVNVALSTGYSVAGQGAGYYISDSLATSALAAAHPRFCKADAAGRYFRLAGDSIVAEQAGAVGDGTTDDTAALQAALATGRDVFLPTGYTFRFTGNLTIAYNYQRFGGPGLLKPEGAVGVVVNNSATGVELDLTFNAPGHTGIALTINTANRVRITRLHGIDVFNLLYVTKANTVALEWCWATCRGYGIKWYGDASNRSDLFHINNAVIAPGAGTYGFDWDGNCHSLIIKYLGLVCSSSGTVSGANAKGLVIRNTAASTAPAIGRFGHLEVDYSGTHGIDIQAGADYEFVQSYILGSTGDGIRIAAGVNDREVRISGGKYRGNTGYGINALGGVVLYSGNADLQSNTTAATNGSVWTEPLRQALDANAYWTISGGNPLLVDDANDYYSYDRATNVRQWFVGGSAVFGNSANAAIAYKPLQLPVYTFATLPASPANGWVAVITDSNSVVYNASAAGGGANTVKVCYLGGAWKIA